PRGQGDESERAEEHVPGDVAAAPADVAQVQLRRHEQAESEDQPEDHQRPHALPHRGTEPRVDDRLSEPHVERVGGDEREGVEAPLHSTTTLSPPLRPNVSGLYISSALVGGTTNVPGVVARATYE